MVTIEMGMILLSSVLEKMKLMAMVMLAVMVAILTT